MRRALLGLVVCAAWGQVPPPTITSPTTLPNGQRGVFYSFTFTAVNGALPLTWDQPVGPTPPPPPPPSLTLSSTGVLSGTITANTGTYMFPVRVRDSLNRSHQLTFTITVVNPPPMSISTSSPLPDATLSSAYNTTLMATGGDGTYTWQLVSSGSGCTAVGPLPPGLLLSQGSGVISGTPTQAGAFSFCVQAADGNTLFPQFARKSLSLTVNPRPAITTALPNGRVGTAYSQTLQAANGTPPFTWSVNGVLPPGLTLNSSTGVLSGTPTLAGIFSFSISAVDSWGASAVRSYTVVIVVPLAIQTSSPLKPDGTQGAALSRSITAAGGTTPYTWSVAGGTIPPGTTFTTSGNSGLLSGKPTVAGTFNFIVQVSDSSAALQQTATGTFQIVINGPISITTTSLPAGTRTGNYAQALQVAGGTPPYTWSLTNALPPNLTLTAGTGTISGTISASAALQTFPFTANVVDAAGAGDSQALGILVNDVPRITTLSLPNGTRTIAYSRSLGSAGGTPPLAWSSVAGALPTGLTVSSSTGVISGTPSATGPFSFSIQLTDANGVAGSQAYSVTINDFPSITTSSLPQGTVGFAYPATALTGSGGQTPYTWAIIGSLPSGLALNTSTGVISGTPAAAGTVNFTVQLTDGLGIKVTSALSITINTAPIITTASLPNGTRTFPYSQSVQGTGGAIPYTWSISAGALPGGLALNGSTGVISGTPTAAGGPTSFTVRLTDSVGAFFDQPLSITIVVEPSITTTSVPDGTAGFPYPSTTLAGSGGTLPYTWSVIGSLPPGLTLNSSTGLISGTPTQAGNFAFSGHLADALGASATHAYSLNLAATPAVATSVLPDGTVGNAYSQTLQGSGGTPPYTWTVSSGSLPSGLSLNGSTGVISGMPLAPPGLSNFTVTLTDSRNATASRALSLNVTASGSPLTVTTASLPNGTVGVVYSQTLTASGGSGTYVWAITAGALPPGLNLTPAGVISGSPAGPAGAANFTVTVTDSVNNTANRALSITIVAAPAIVTTSLPNGTTGTAYSQTLAGSGGTAPYGWSISSGSLPPGLSLNAASGAITGMPSAAGTSNFTALLTDALGATASRALSIMIVGGPSITTTSLPNGTAGFAYPASTLAGSGGTAPYTWSITAGALPGGLTLNAATGAISGTPTAAGAFNFTAMLTDALGATASRALSITILTAPSITTSSLPNGPLGVPYPAQTLTGTGGATPYLWSVTSGSLPPGLSLSSAGVISGTATSAGAFSFTVQLTDALGASASRALSITINTAPNITTASLPNGTRTFPYSQNVQGTGGAIPYTWSISAGALPGGLVLNGSTGVISGTPTAAGGPTSFTVRLTDSVGAFFDQPLSITIVVEPSITTTSVPDGTAGFPYPSTTLAGSGGTLPYTWSVIGSLPPGLTLNSSTGLISGTPTQAGNFAFSGHLADALGASAARAYSLNLAATPTVATAVLPDGTVGNAYSQTLQGSGGTPPYTWTVSSGSLPSGLSLNGSTGVISGMPLAPAGLSNFTVTLTDSRNATASRALSLNVTASGSPLTVTTASLPSGTVGVAYSRTLTASGGSGAYLWTITAGALPPGLNLNPAGVISGSPAGPAGASTFTVTVTDSANNTSNRALFITIVAAPAIVTTSLPNGSTGAAYSQTLAGSGGTTPYSWSISSGSLPPGLSLNAASGAITGMPSAAGTSNFTALLTDALGATASRALSILVVSGPSITTTSLPNGTRTFFYSQTVQGTGGARPYTWSIAVGSLPVGLALNSSTGVISGTPTAAGGPTPFTVRLTDSAAATFDQPLSLTIVVEPSITTTSIPDGTVGNSYSQTLQGTGGTPPYTWAVTSGSLPSGLRLTASTGGISGTPTAPAGLSNFTVTLTDALNATASRALSINITATASSLTVTTASLPAATVGVAYSQTLTASGGSGSYLWAVTAGGLPSGLNLSSSGVISGSPTAAGTFDFSVQVTDSAGARATRSLSLTVIAPLAIQTTSLAAGTVGTSYSASLTATGGRPPYAWSGTGGALPGGLSLAQDGTISGVPSAAGTSTFTATVIDSANNRAVRQFSITINLPPVSGVTVIGLPPTPQPLLQPSLNLRIDAQYPVDITGTVTLTFASEAGGDDLTVMFANGGRTATFSIPAGATQALNPVGVQTGTVAGLITLTVTLRAAGSDVTPQPAPVFTIRVPQQAPSVTRAQITRTPTGLSFSAVGFTTTRSATTARFTVEPVAGSTLQATTITVDVAALFGAWFQNQTSNATGGQFTYTQPFVIQGDMNAVRSMTLTLLNAVGASPPVAAQVP